MSKLLKAWKDIDGELIFIEEGESGEGIIGPGFTRVPSADRVVSNDLLLSDDYAYRSELVAHTADSLNPHSTTFTQAASADAGTDITAAEAETLTDQSVADSLHNHRRMVDETDTNRVEVLDGGDVRLSNYPQTRNDTTSNDEKVLTTDSSGNVVLRRVLPFTDYIEKISDTGAEVGINNTSTLEDYLTLTFTAPEAGDYDLDWFYIWSLNNGSRDFVSEIILDGDFLLETSHRQEPKDSAGQGVNLRNTTGGITNSGTDQRYYTTGFKRKALSQGSHTILIQWRCGTSGDRAAIYEGNIRIKRVS